MGGQNAHEKELNIANYQRNANQNYYEVSPRIGQNGHHKKKKPVNNKFWRKKNPSLLVGM